MRARFTKESHMFTCIMHSWQWACFVERGYVTHHVELWSGERVAFMVPQAWRGYADGRTSR